MKTIAVIPARYASTRMPGKPLADVLGKPMIYWVYKAARACPKLDDVLIATDDERIADACKTYDMRYIMTRHSQTWPSGSTSSRRLSSSVSTTPPEPALRPIRRAGITRVLLMTSTSPGSI